MATPREAPRSDIQRRPARDLIDAIVHSMEDNLERLKYSTLAPSRYLVYLHPAEFARLEGIVPLLRNEAARALDEALERLNRPPVLQRYRDRLAGRSAPPPVQNAAAEWQIDFLADADDAVEEGGILVDVELLLPPGPEPGAGSLTRRLKTMYQRPRPQTTDRLPATAPIAGEPFATVTFQDDRGPHSYDITKDSVTIGRGGAEYPVDIRIAASPDVSREHARIRRDTQTGQFFLIDLSTLGTTLNGRHVPPGFVDSDGSKRENQVETPLPDRARIGLADTVHLEFERKRQA